MEHQYALCLHGFIPVRNDADERAEMISQFLFGEYAEILEQKQEWLQIRQIFDGYQGWVNRKGIAITENRSENRMIVKKLYARTSVENTKQKLLLPAGATIPAIENKKFELNGSSYILHDDDAIALPGTISVEDLADELCGVSYLWGGRCGAGFDCSGLSQFICRMSGKQIARDAAEQSKEGRSLSFISEAKTGDLAFFDNENGEITHVGVMLGNSRILHASGTVRIDTIDQQGVYNHQSGKYTHKLRVIKRLL